MVLPEVRITLRGTLQSMASDYLAINREIYDDEALDLADELQAASPVGATGDLRRGWNVIPARRQLGGVRSSVVNNADAAYFRIVGRGPGKFPPAQPIDSWVRAKNPGLSDSERRSRVFLIQRKIATRGTDRFISKQNILGVAPGESVEASPKVGATRQKIINRVNQVELPRRRRR